MNEPQTATERLAEAHSSRAQPRDRVTPLVARRRRVPLLPLVILSLAIVAFVVARWII